MTRADVITLIKENRTGHGVHEVVTDTERTVMCNVESVRRSEYYTALNAGFQPEYVFTLTLAEDYRNERLVKYHGQKFRVINVYQIGQNAVRM